MRVLGTPDESPPPPVTAGGVRERAPRRRLSLRAPRPGRRRARDARLPRAARGHVLRAHEPARRGPDGRDSSRVLRGEYRAVGTSDGLAVAKQTLTEPLPRLRRLAHVREPRRGPRAARRLSRWTSQVVRHRRDRRGLRRDGSTLTLDLLGCPCARSAARQRRPRRRDQGALLPLPVARRLRLRQRRPDRPARSPRSRPRSGPPTPETHPGDSGTLWFYDPPTCRRRRARRRACRPCRPPDRGPTRAAAAADRDAVGRAARRACRRHDRARSRSARSCPRICRALDVEIVRDWSTGHDEYWGRSATSPSAGRRATSLTGALVDADEGEPAAHRLRGRRPRRRAPPFTMGRGGFVPLADVPDYVWIGSRAPTKPIQHFADIDIHDIDGGAVAARPLLGRSRSRSPPRLAGLLRRLRASRRRPGRRRAALPRLADLGRHGRLAEGERRRRASSPRRACWRTTSATRRSRCTARTCTTACRP